MQSSIVSDQLIQPSISPAKAQTHPSRPSKKIFLCISISIALLILSGVLFSIFKSPDHQPTPDPSRHQISVSETQSDAHALQSSFEERVVLSGVHQITAKDINSKRFPRLRELVINSPDLVRLQLPSDLRLDTLVVNNSKLTSFSYNSTQLRTLILIDNANMTEFVNSTLPLLSIITITRTNFQKWERVRFGNISYFQIFECKLKSLPEYFADSVQQLDVVNTTVTQSWQNYFSKVPVQRARFQRCESDKFTFNHSTELKALEIKGSMSTVILKQLQSLASLEIYAPNMNHLQLTSIPSLSHATVQSNSLINLYLSNVPLTSLAIFPLSKLQQLSLRSVPLKQFSSLELPSLRYLIIDFSKCQQHLLKPSTLITYLTVYNYRPISPFVNKDFPNLRNFHLTNSSLPRFDANEGLESLDLENIQSDGELQLTLNSRLEYLSLNEVDISTLSNLKLEELLRLEIKKTQIKSITNNSFGVLYQIELMDNPILEDVRDNNFPKVEWGVFLDNPKLRLRQEFPSPGQFFFENNSIYILESLTDSYFPNLPYLRLNQDNCSNFTNINLSSVKEISLRGNSFVNFANNTFNSLEYLFLNTDIVNIRGNKVPMMRDLELRRAQSLDFGVLLEEFADYKKDGVDLQRIGVPDKTDDETIQEIKKIYPKADVFK